MLRPDYQGREEYLVSGILSGGGGCGSSSFDSLQRVGCEIALHLTTRLHWT